MKKTFAEMQKIQSEIIQEGLPRDHEQAKLIHKEQFARFLTELEKNGWTLEEYNKIHSKLRQN